MIFAAIDPGAVHAAIAVFQTVIRYFVMTSVPPMACWMP